jgi:tetratricopeptide (TPR) repeat protein
MAAEQPEGISVTILAKDCKRELLECLKSLKPFVQKKWGDEIVVLDTGSSDDTPRVAAQNGARVINAPELTSPLMLKLVEKYMPEYLEKCKEFPKFNNGFISDFALARQLVTNQVKNELIFWVDSDDILVNATELRQLAAQFFADKSKNCLFMLYDYAFDATDGECTTSLWRERILRKKHYVWKGACHESMIPRSGQVEGVERCPPHIKLVHKNHSAPEFSDVRNYAILRAAHDDAKKHKRWIDPRWEFYLGNACRGLEQWGTAFDWYSKVLRHSGSREDRYTACLNIATIYMLKQRTWRALDWLWQASKIFPEEPRTYFAIARCYHELGQHANAVVWTQFGEQFPKPELLTAVDPQSYDFYPTIFKCLALRELGQWDEAINVALVANEIRPTFEPAQELLQETRGLAHNEEIKSRVLSTVQMAHSRGGAADIIHCLKPEIRRGFPEFQLEVSAPQAEKHITYICGQTVEAWDGTSADDGIGGSEKMVLQLSREWAKMGYTVDVYGNPKPENRYKSINGVTFRPAYAFNPDLERDVVIAWRNHGILDMPIKARKIFVDLHDIQQPDYFSLARSDRCDGYFFKSEFHAENVLSLIPEDKLIISRNGIDLADFDQEAGPRNLQKVVFCSSGDRGMLGLLRMWARIAKEFPKANLDLFYGFTPLYMHRANQAEYQHFWDEGCDRHMLDYAEECSQYIDRLPNVTLHGRVSHRDMMRHLMEAGVWCYPTGFPEISCMAAMEAQIAGAIPLVFPTGALKETVQFGHRVPDYGQMITTLRKVFASGDDLKTYREEMSTWAREAFNLKPLAEEWAKRFES